MAASTPDKRKIVIIGAGITGISCAAMLAEQGHAVAIVEKSDHIAPLLRGFNKNGWHFDTGFHYAHGLEKGGALRAWLESLGIDIDFDDCRPVSEIVINGSGRWPVPACRDDVARTYPDALSSYDKFCQDAADLYRKSPFMTAESTCEYSPFSLDRTRLERYFSRIGMSGNLRMALESRCMLYGVSPKDASLEDFMLISGNGRVPSMSIPGGGEAIASSFEKRLDALDVELRLGLAMEAIHATNHHVKSVILDNGDELMADAIVYTGNPRSLRSIIRGGGIRPAWFSHLESIEATPEPVVMYGIGGAEMPELQSWYLTPEDGRFKMLEEQASTICVMTGRDRGDGWKTCMLMGMTRNGGIKQDIEARALSILPELKKSWRRIGVYGGNSMRKFVYGSDGSAFGYAHACDEIPLLPVARLRGLYLAGQNILLPGLLGCVISAAIAAGIIGGVEPILRKFSQCAAG